MESFSIIQATEWVKGTLRTGERDSASENASCHTPYSMSHSTSYRKKDVPSEEVEPAAPVEPTALSLHAISTDSRALPSDALFIPLKGERFDGHDYIASAIANGARAVLSHRELAFPVTVPVIAVRDTAQALLDFAGGYRQLCGGVVVGITGSVGKTTTKELVYAVLQQRFCTQKTEGNHNNTVGLPLTLCTMTRQTEVLVAEMGMNHFGEISRMTAAARPNIAVITNIGTSHIEFLGSREGICRAKLEILEGLQPGGYAILCGDEPLLWEKREQIARTYAVTVITYGLTNPECDLTAALHDDGTFDVVIHHRLPNLPLPNHHSPITCFASDDTGERLVGGRFTAQIHLPGTHNVNNALAAAAVGLLLGMQPQEITAGLAAYHASGMRQRIYEANGYQIFADCYNASPDAMEAVLKVLGSMAPKGQRFAVLGSMLELGDYAEEGHKRAGRAAAQNADALYAYGANAPTMVAAAQACGMTRAYAFDDQKALVAQLCQETKPGDALLFKGSRSMKMEQALHLFLESSAAVPYPPDSHMGVLTRESGHPTGTKPVWGEDVTNHD